MFAASLIGPAGAVLQVMENKAARAKKTRAAAVKCLFYGAPGVGKSALAWATARALAGHELAIEHSNGKEVTVNTVRQWISELACSGSLFGDWTVKVVDELDCCSKDAQDLLLTYLDRLPPGRAFIGTSNLQLDMLQERFQTRLQQFKIDAPEEGEIAELITEQFPGVSESDARHCAFGAGGNVRAALLDAEAISDCAAASAATSKTKKGKK